MILVVFAFMVVRVGVSLHVIKSVLWCTGKT